METNYTKQPLCVIETRGYSKDEAYELARRYRQDKLFDKLIDCAIATNTEEVNESVFRFHVFEIYVVEELKFFQLLRHYIRKWLTILRVYPSKVVLIKNDKATQIENFFENFYKPRFVSNSE